MRLVEHIEYILPGIAPSDLHDALRSAQTLVTFNGTLFRHSLPEEDLENRRLPQRHIDLRYTAIAAGLVGGQKAIERTLGLDIRRGVEDVDGAVAVLLWHRYLRGEEKALRTLIAYNVADVLGMTGILDELTERVALPDFLVGKPQFSKRSISKDGWAAVDVKLPPAERLGRTRPTFSDIFDGTAAAQTTVVGIDLTGSERKPSGVCALRGDYSETTMLRSDEEIVAFVHDTRPALVWINSPLSLPRGRTMVTDDDPARSEFGIMRSCERALKRRGINVYPCLLPSMQRLTERGIHLAARLQMWTASDRELPRCRAGHTRYSKERGWRRMAQDGLGRVRRSRRLCEQGSPSRRVRCHNIGPGRELFLGRKILKAWVDLTKAR